MGKLVANVDDDVKARAAALYDSMGMSLSTAVNMFLRQSLVDNGLPFRPTRHTPDGYPVPPVHNAYMFERSEKGHVILPADWDDSEEREEKELRNEPYRRKSQDAKQERERKNEEARNFARGTVADKARMEIGKGWYEGENHVWSYYEWGPGQKPCWYRSDDFDSYNGGTSESYAHAVEICGDPRKRDPKQSER